MSVRSSSRGFRFLRHFQTPARTHYSCQSEAVALDTEVLTTKRDALEISNSDNAHNLFERSPQKDTSHYNHLLFEYSRNDCNLEALNHFKYMHQTGVWMDGSSFSSVLKVCGCLFDVLAGRQVHCQCFKSGFFSDVSVGTSLVDMYMKTENIYDGERVFHEMGEKNIVSWTSLLTGFASNKLIDRAIEVFRKMWMDGIKPNPCTFSAILGALAEDGAIEKGAQIHAVIVKKGFASTIFVANALINMYSKSRMAREASRIFNGLKNRNTVSWNGMIAGLVTNGHDLEALDMFYQMRLSGVKLTQMSFLTVIKLCANLKALTLARQLHARAVRHGFDFDHNIRTALMVSYTKCSQMDDAFQIFSPMHQSQNVVSWTAMISGFLQNGGKDQAVALFSQMRRKSISPNHFTYSTILSAHPKISPYQIHAEVIKTNYETSPTVGTALLDAYVKTASIKEAAKVFEMIEEKDIVAWSAMLAGYAQAENIEGAVNVFQQLAREGVRPNEYTFSSVIDACNAPTATAEQGKQFHASSIKTGYSNALCVSSALVTMYAKRGNIESADAVFKRQQVRDLVSWNSMITGYAQHGYGKKALMVFEEMRMKNMAMDSVTFIGIISACTHVGLVKEGERYFDMMINDLQILPTMEIYSCMVDLYSRAGMLEKAVDLINAMPFPAGGTVWRTLLAACRVHRNIEMGKFAARKLISLEPQDSSGYVLLSNLYASTKNWKERAKIRKLMDVRKVKKETGFSWIEFKNKTYSFMAGDVSHPMSDQIYMKLDEVSIWLKEKGYQPDTNSVLHDVEDEHKETILSQHSERLAIAFGLIVMPPGSTIQIFKNLRVCGDCHNVIKLISEIECREIIVRDSTRFHHFKGGLCSCGEFW
ncbi:OLC1v1014997C1 [Oldenlandia corymbosa var. corymbosa]|uniref:OLC1v1014997C1 n=1 Tax=Oldenlandia corymbosa var. corymbosa TaxID=529605 RepID=A0AAV1E295_OLDCO|nr:OLC1v1014997C1 [Oldenlandia corymbosa var. corymbosa]